MSTHCSAMCHFAIVNCVADFHISVQLGLNHLADHTHDEYRSMLGYRADLAPERSLQSTPFRYANSKPPPSVDWREQGAVTDVKNQEQVSMPFKLVLWHHPVNIADPFAHQS